MRWLKIVLIVVCLLLPMTAMATESIEKVDEVSQSEIQTELLEQFDFSDIDSLMEEMFPEHKMSFFDLVTGLISGEMEFSFDLIKEFVWQQFTYELENSRTSMIHIVLIVLVGAIFANFSGVFQSTQVSEISFTMLYMLLITICLNNFRILVQVAAGNLQKLMEFMTLLGPIYFLAVGIATGSSTSIAFYQLILLLVFLAELLILNFLLPLTQIYLIMRILGEFSSDVPLTKFSEFLETVVSWTLKTLVAGVVGLNVVQGLLNPAIDSVKRSLITKGGEALPIIGDVIGGATEIVLGTAVLIKNGIGVAGMIICLIVCLAPILQMALTALLYQLLSALVQPISDKRMVNCISGMANSTKLLLKILVTIGVLFMLTIAVVATTAGG